MKHSDFSLIPTFVAIMEEASYTEAARRLGISQSAVSQTISKLQALFKDPLFIRESHGVKPTEFALSIYPTLSSAIDAIKNTTEKYNEFAPETASQNFAISSLSALGIRLLPTLSNLINEQAPGITLSSFPISSEDPTALLRDQTYDLILDVCSPLYSHLSSQELLVDNLCVIARKDHPRIQGGTISEEEFLREKHVTHTSMATRNAFLIGRGFSFEPILEQREVAWQASSLLDMMPVISQNDYLGLYSRTLAERVKDEHNLQILDCPAFAEPIRICMYWHSSRQHNSAHKWLRDMTQNAAHIVQG